MSWLTHHIAIFIHSSIHSFIDKYLQWFYLTEDIPVSNNLTSNLFIQLTWWHRCWTNEMYAWENENNSHSSVSKEWIVATCKEFTLSHTFDSHNMTTHERPGVDPSIKDLLLMTLKIGWTLEAHCHLQMYSRRISHHEQFGGIGPWDPICNNLSHCTWKERAWLLLRVGLH